jgi:hypothetical protein
MNRVRPPHHSEPSIPSTFTTVQMKVQISATTKIQMQRSIEVRVMARDF